MPQYSSALKKDYEDKWRTLVVDYEPEAVKSIAKTIYNNRTKYQGYWSVPYWFIGLCDYRESAFHPKGVLHNGQRIIGTNKKTTIVPKGRGPFATWPEATRDALKLKGLDVITDWSIARASFIIEGFNGYGYRNKGVPSPYLYSHTNHYKDGSWDDDARGGKYIRDRVYDPNVYDKQIGALAVLKCLATIDPSVEAREPFPAPPDVEPPVKKPIPKKPIPKKPKPLVKSTTFWAQIGTVLTAIGGALTDWRVAAVLVIGAIAAFVIWQRYKKDDVNGWFK